jgi:hypothetical protein
MKDKNESIERPVLEVDAGGGDAEPTFVGILQEAEQRAAAYRQICDQDVPNQRAAAREFSLAITQLQDSAIRFARGYALLSGRTVQDLEAVDRMSDADAPVGGD